MSFSDADFEEIDLDGEVQSITSLKFANTQKIPTKAKKVYIPILNKNTADPNTFEYEVLLKQINMNKKEKVDSNFVKTPSPRSDTRNTIERLLFNHQLSENRKQFLRKEKEINEIKSCTFSPKIHSHSKLLKKSNSERNQKLEISIGGSVGNYELQTNNAKNQRFSPFLSKSLKSLGNLEGKSHSQEHNSMNQFITPRKAKIHIEGRPPIPKKK